ncbi:M23 family metallopeptidase, partial [Xanthomonas sp. Kuri4-1]
WAAGLAVGDVVAPGTLLGEVGNSGNARSTPPHLHYGIYRRDGAYDPLPLLRAPR